MATLIVEGSVGCLVLILQLTSFPFLLFLPKFIDCPPLGSVYILPRLLIQLSDSEQDMLGNTIFVCLDNGRCIRKRKYCMELCSQLLEVKVIKVGTSWFIS